MIIRLVFWGEKQFSSEAVNKLDEIVVKNYYRDKAEWLREKMRNAIRAKKPIIRVNENIENNDETEQMECVKEVLLG